jgi:imidazolonepropionase-like amidohydrolase
MKREADFLAENAAQLVTLSSSPRATDPEEKLGVTRNGTLAAKGGRIVWVGPAAETSKQVSLLTYHFGVNHVWKVVKRGRVVWEVASAHPTIRVDPR